MSRLIRLLIVCVLVAASCGYGEEPGEKNDRTVAGASPGPNFGAGTVIIDKGDETELLEVEVAHTEEQRARGLMFRRSLGDDKGMVFIYFQASKGGFWMKNTLIPLSIAFFDEEGQILMILDMQPCEKEPCRLYDPGVAYWGALEVEQGAFERWGVQTGDVIKVTQ